MRLRRTAAFLATATAVTLSLSMTAGVAQASPPQKFSLAQVVGGLRDAKPQPARALAPVAPTAAAPTCAGVKADMARYAASGAQSVLCIDSTAPATTPATTGDKKAAAAWCSGEESQTWWITRSETCVHGITLVYTVTQIPTGAILGTATFDVSHEITLSNTNTEISDDAAVTLVASSGELAVPIASFSATCSAPCSALDGDGFTLEKFTKGETEDAFFSYGDDPVDSADLFNTSYSFTVQPPPNTVPVDPTANWSTPSSLFRCDDLVSGFDGCVIPEFTPELEVTVSRHQAAAIGIAVAQSLPDGWGSAVELTRLANESAAEANRRKICEDGTWVKRPDVRDDSCDEYAFARSRQSGGQLGLTGKDCAEIVPWFDDTDGTWYFEGIRYTGQERCLRAHVPLDENSLVGSDLGALTNSARLLDNDKYWVGVYN
ncbi:hypothetical protein [Amycolatopsis sp. NPDC098790]|uniref:hypothetical protein n=1 Tax=Amycolatopsis sp. NPDC098790 TaxID=3363939 RepID=UPI0037FF4A0D